MSQPLDAAAGRPGCRAVLREALAARGPLDAATREHVEACAFCAARLRAKAALMPALRQKPAMPAVSMATLLEGVYERAVERAESGPVGELLADAVPVPAEELAADAWPEPLLASPVASRIAANTPDPGRVAWARLRDSILDRIAAGNDDVAVDDVAVDDAAVDDAAVDAAPARRARGRWWIGVVGTAVAAGVVLAVVGGGERPQPPTITIQDISRLPAGGSFPGVDFAVIRRGGQR